MKDLTVLYYSANTEDEKFENNITNNILKQKGDIPLISVTQKSMPHMGENICVGKQHNCYGNEFRQIQIGLKKVKTKYIITAEADVLYPPEYFQFQPTSADYYRFANVWVCYLRNSQQERDKIHHAFFKSFSDGAQIVKKDVWVDQIEKNIGTNTKWYTKEDTPQKMPNLSRSNPLHSWSSINPVITFKTIYGVRRFTSVKKDVRPKNSLPYWGNIEKLATKLFI